MTSKMPDDDRWSRRLLRERRTAELLGRPDPPPGPLATLGWSAGMTGLSTVLFLVGRWRGVL